MTSQELENLARAGKLKREPATQAEFDGLLRSGEARLKDARGPTLAQESRVDLAHNAAHALALAALHWHGFRADGRYIVLQVVPQTLGLGREVWRVLDKCRGLRNMADHEGYLEADERLLADLVRAAETVDAAVSALGPLPPASG